MREVETVIDDRHYIVQVPDDEDDYSRGIVVGPPDFPELPEDLDRRLHEELFARGLIRKRDVMKRRGDIFSALQATFAFDTEKILEKY